MAENVGTRTQWQQHAAALASLDKKLMAASRRLQDLGWPGSGQDEFAEFASRVRKHRASALKMVDSDLSSVSWDPSL